MAIYSFPKSERLYEKKRLDSLFAKGRSILVYPFRILYELADKNDSWMQDTHKPRIKVGVGVSKKRHRKAVQRNRIKRLSRESYRLNKNLLHSYLAENNIRLTIMFMYIANSPMSFDEMNEKMRKALNEWIIQHQKETDSKNENNQDHH